MHFLKREKFPMPSGPDMTEFHSIMIILGLIFLILLCSLVLLGRRKDGDDDSRPQPKHTTGRWIPMERRTSLD